jgi:hypothetical protein
MAQYHGPTRSTRTIPRDLSRSSPATETSATAARRFAIGPRRRPISQGGQEAGAEERLKSFVGRSAEWSQVRSEDLRARNDCLNLAESNAKYPELNELCASVIDCEVLSSFQDSLQWHTKAKAADSMDEDQVINEQETSVRRPFQAFEWSRPFPGTSNVDYSILDGIGRLILVLQRCGRIRRTGGGIGENQLAPREMALIQDAT